MEDIQLRAWDKKKKFMIEPFRIQNLSFKFASCKDHIYMLYTGLKDREGKEIYDGDIISFTDYPQEIITSNVFFKDGCFMATGAYGVDFPIKEFDKIKVIGDIYRSYIDK